MIIINYKIRLFKMEDFDKYHPIPRELGKYNYIYASGSTKNEVFRHFVLPKKVYEIYKEKAKAIYRFSDTFDSNPFYFRKNDRVNMIAPFENSYGFKMLLLTTCTSSNPDNCNCELRNKRKILKQFTTSELNEIQKELDKMDDIVTCESTESGNEVEDDADDKSFA